MHRNERFLQDFYKNFELLRASCGFDSRRDYQKETAMVSFLIMKGKAIEKFLIKFWKQKRRADKTHLKWVTSARRILDDSQFRIANLYGFSQIQLYNER